MWLAGIDLAPTMNFFEIDLPASPLGGNDQRRFESALAQRVRAAARGQLGAAMECSVYTRSTHTLRGKVSFRVNSTMRADMAFEALESVVVGIKETSKATIRWIQG
jgi:hypothetical protein